MCDKYLQVIKVWRDNPVGKVVILIFYFVWFIFLIISIIWGFDRIESSTFKAVNQIFHYFLPFFLCTSALMFFFFFMELWRLYDLACLFLWFISEFYFLNLMFFSWLTQSCLENVKFTLVLSALPVCSRKGVN